MITKVTTVMYLEPFVMHSALPALVALGI